MYGSLVQTKTNAGGIMIPLPEDSDNGTVRVFSTGATRDTTSDKHEPWGFTSALVEKEFSAYMHSHRKQSDGSLRASDNWKRGIPVDAYKHSLSRHIQDLRLVAEGYPGEARDQDIIQILMSIKFNVEGWAHELLKARAKG